MSFRPKHGAARSVEGRNLPDVTAYFLKTISWRKDVQQIPHPFAISFFSLFLLSHDLKSEQAPVHLHCTKPNHSTMKTIIAILFCIAALSSSPLKSQTAPDTIWGTGIFQTLNEQTTGFIPGTLLSLAPHDMLMVIPDTTYQFTTLNGGWTPYTLPVYIDSTTGINNLVNNGFSAFPGSGSELNIFFSQKEKGVIDFYNMAGRLVKSKEFNSDKEYLSFEKLPLGMYVYSIKTENGFFHSSKFLKQNTSTSGPSQRPNNQENNLKDLQTHQAEYWVKWEHPDFYTDSTLVTLNEGNNIPKNFFMTPLPGLPTNQDIAGIVYNGDDNYSTIAGATVILKHLNTGEVFTQITGSDGSFFFEDMPVRMGWTGTDQNYLFSAGGIEGMYSFVNVPYTTPMHLENTWTAEDTINDQFNVVLKYKLENSSAQHIKEQTSNGTQQTVVLYYYLPDVSAHRRIQYNNYFQQFMEDENNIFTFEEAVNPVHGITGITIGSGTPNTQTYPESVQTPLGHILYPVKWANTTMSTSNYIVFVHEIKRAIGLLGVAWPSVMQTPAVVYNEEDKSIAQFERSYWNSIYQDGKTWISLEFYLAENLGSKTQKAGE